jgi:hypothetical protein
MLGYAGGRGNYKVQDIASRRMFVLRDVIFEEGQPHHTSPSVGEDNIPLVDATLREDKLNNCETTDQQTNQQYPVADPENHADPSNQQSCHVSIPAEPTQQPEMR